MECSLKRRGAVGAWLFWTALLGLIGALALQNAWNQIILVAASEARYALNRDGALHSRVSALGEIYATRSPSSAATEHGAPFPLSNSDTSPSIRSKKLYPLDHTFFLAGSPRIDHLETRLFSPAARNSQFGPDAWERVSLRKLQQGQSEVMELIDENNTTMLRQAIPLRQEEQCLKCHTFPAASSGNVVGGVGVKLDMQQYVRQHTGYRNRVILILSIFWAIGSIGIWLFCRHLLEIRRRQARILAETREDEESFRALADYSVDWECWVDEEGRFRYISPSCKEITGYPPDNFIEDPSLYISIIHGEDQQRVSEHNARHLTAKADPESIEFRLVTAEGKVIWIEHRCQAVFSGNGQLLGRRVSNRDITRVKDLQLQMEQETKLFISGPVVVMKWYPVWYPVAGGPVEYISPNVREQLGYRPEQLLSGEMNFFSLIHLEDAGRVRREIERCTASGVDDFEQEYRIKDAGGEFRYFFDKTVIIRGVAGEVIRYHAYLIDITGRKEIEQALIQSEERLSLALDGAETATWVWNIATDEMTHNERWPEMLGFNRDEVLPLAAWRDGRIHPDDRERVRRALNDHLENRSSLYRTEHRLQKKTGEYIWVLDAGKVFQWDDTGKPQLAAGIHMDISERKYLEEQMHEAKRLDAVGMLAGGIAHDFNNLLTTVLGNIDLALLGMARQADIKPFLQSAKSAVLSTKELTDKFLIFSRSADIRIGSVAIEPLLRDTVQKLLGTRQVACIFDIAPGLREVAADPNQLRVIIENIVLNCFEAMSDRPGILTVSCDNCNLPENASLPLPAGSYVKIGFQDNGPGIDPALINRIFEPYFSTKMRDSHRGVGLGLAVCHSIIKKHGGYIEVTGTSVEGTLITVFLPAASMTEVPETTIRDYRKSEGEIGRERVLLMDDDSQILAIGRSLLENIGYSVDTAENGQQAITCYENALGDGQPYAFVIFDLIIPVGLDGRQTLARLLQIDPDIRAIISSGDPTDPVMLDYEQFGFVAALAKPFALAELIRVVEKAVRRPADG